MPPYVGMARKQNGGYNGSISVQMPIFHLVVNYTRLKTLPKTKHPRIVVKFSWHVHFELSF